MNKLIFSLIIFFFLAFPTLSFADTSNNCGTIYGGQCTSSSLTINKTVKNPVTGEFVDTLGSNSPHFLPSQTVNFRLHVQNTSNTDLNGIQVQDKFPDFLDFVSGPGTFDNNTRALTFTLDNLKTGEFRDIDVTGKVKSGSNLPNTNLTCVTNYAQASKDNQSSSDTAVFCIENQILAPVQELPKTGPASTMLILFGSVFMLAISAFLYKKARV